MSLFGRKPSPVAAKPVVETELAAAAPPAGAPAPPSPAGEAESPLVTAEQEAPPPAALASTAARLAFLDKGTAAMTSTPPKPPAASVLTGAPRMDQSPRRTLDMPSASVAGRRLEQPPAIDLPAAPVETQRRLVVGRDISLAGEIASCDALVVEGTVEAKLREGHYIEVTETGLFKGSVEIDDADIGGRFEGDIIVRNRLRVRSSGRIIGTIVYGELEVESGGRLVGAIQLYEPKPKAAVAVSPVAAAPAPAPAAAAPVLADVQPAQVYAPPLNG